MALDLQFLKNQLGSIEQCFALIHRYPWNLAIEQRQDEWFIFTGEMLVLRTDSRDTVDAFVYGMAMASTSIPDPMMKILKHMQGLDNL